MIEFQLRCFSAAMPGQSPLGRPVHGYSWLKLVLVGGLLFSGFFPAAAQIAPGQSDALQTNRMIDTPNLPQKSVATSDDTTSLYFNPAGLGYHALQLGYFYGRNPQNRLDDHMVFLNLLGIAFSTQWRLGNSNDYARRYTVGMGIINTGS
ncbi:MAG TPA: hypothetical protein PKI36_11410, partial [Turneriella sp.]|nr:hypothetical protein [Turneriella sp.]